jgi:hypothetical protein
MALNSSRFSNLTILGLLISYLFVYHLGLSSSYVSTTSTTLVTGNNAGATGTNIAAGDAANMTKIAFDEIRQIIYKEAIRPPLLNNRKKFTLEGWRRGNGGLDDTDRKVLGDLYYSAGSVFEYGLGESTLIAAHTGVPRYAGVDSDANWLTQSREASKLDHFRFNFADIGKIQAFGNPVDPSLQKNHYDYQIAPLVLEDEPFDVYLVDGRYRVACACISILHAMKTGGNMELVRVGVHDNAETGRGYGILKNVADVVVENNKLWVYKLKKSTTEKDLFELWKELRATVTR